MRAKFSSFICHQLICFQLIICLIQAFPSGAPEDACDTLTPRHPGTYSSFDKPPYYVVASADTYDTVDIFSYKPKKVKVDISGAPFKGFIVTAIDPHTGERVGSFSSVKGTSKLPCSAITHTDNRLKKYASLLWIPPEDQTGHVTFIATVVHSFPHYYPGIVANVVHKPEYETPHPYNHINMEDSIEDPLLKYLCELI